MEGGTPGSQVVSDVAFLQDGTRNFLVVAGSVDNFLVIADMDDNFRMRKVQLTSNEEPTAAGNRQVEWAVGSNYVWVNGGQTEEMYVVEISGGMDTAKVVKTLKNVPDGKGACHGARVGLFENPLALTHARCSSFRHAVAFVNNFAKMRSAQ